jgi:hypothetical protein
MQGCLEEVQDGVSWPCLLLLDASDEEIDNEVGMDNELTSTP